MNRQLFILELLLLCSRYAPAQNEIDSVLMAEIMNIKIIDVHSHSLPAGAGLNYEASEDYLSLLSSTDPATTLIAPNHTDYISAWRALYGYAYNDMTREHVLEVIKAKKNLIQEKGNAYPAWILDKAGIEKQFVFTMLKEPYTLGQGQIAARFLWVPQAQSLIYPFGSSSNQNSNRNFKYLLGERNVSKVPVTLHEYTSTIITPTLEEWKQKGAVGIKFGLAYQRPLSFAEVSETDAKLVYQKLQKGGQIEETTYKKLQDYIFKFMAREAGRIGLVVFIHTGVGADEYFNVSGSNPALLEPIFNDQSMRQISFDILHGGWPYDKEAGTFLQKPNIYIDFSAQCFLRTTWALSQTLRTWLEWAPEKVMFGTDAYSSPTQPLTCWEELTWVTTKMARESLARALTGMLKDGEITREHALLLAGMVLRENAVRLFNLTK